MRILLFNSLPFSPTVFAGTSRQARQLTASAKRLGASGRNPSVLFGSLYELHGFRFTIPTRNGGLSASAGSCVNVSDVFAAS